MSTTNQDPSTRKPSGSSTHSAARSPSGSPSHVKSRKVTPTGNFFGVGMGTANGLKTLNSGWQVWGGAAPASRNPSVSSAASVPDASVSQSGGGYRSALEEPWSATRATNATWEEVNGSPQRKGVSQMDSHPPLPLHHTRQRQPVSSQLSGLGGPPSGMSIPGQYSPQRFDSEKDPANPSRYPTTSPNDAYGVSPSPFGSQQPLLQSSGSAGSYDSAQASSIVENDLSMALRGMAVEDDYTLSQPQNQSYRQPPYGPQSSVLAGQQPHPPVHQARVGPPIQQPRAPYSGFPQPDYSAYYPGSSRIDYPYPYDAYRTTPDPSLFAASPALSTATTTPGVYHGMGPQTLHPHPVADLHGQQSGMYYEYAGPARPGSQYFYPTQPMMFHALPSHASMPQSVPGPISDKKLDPQYHLQQLQQLHPQNMLYPSLRSSPSPHPQGFPSVDFASQMPMMVPGAMYGHAGVNHPALHSFQHGHRGRRQHHDNTLASRSALLDEFRANKTRGWELRDIFGYVVEFSGDQHGSRFIQQKLENATAEEKQIVFDEIVPHNVLQLVQDVFGNYVIQKIFEFGTPIQKAQLASAMEGHILSLSLQMYGCRVVQKAIEFITPEQQSALVNELDGNVLRCVKDANGNHVIQRLIEKVSPERLGFVNAFRGNVYDLATHPYGCRVLQRCLEYLPEEQTRPLLDELHKYAINLMQDQFGNYVVQFVLEHGQPHDRALVVSKLRGQMLNMSRHKFASNVCEKALITADADMRRVLVEEIMTPKQEGGVSPVVTMMKDQFANYVLQRALSVSEGQQKEALISQIKPQLVNMRRYSSAFSKHLIAIERLLEKCTSSTSEEASGENVSVPPTDCK